MNYFPPPRPQLDPLDTEILEALTTDARIPFSQLALQLKVSNSLIHQRVRKLKTAGVLREPIFQVSPEQLGYETCAFVQIMVTDGRRVYDVVALLREIPEIVECANIAGRYAIMAKVYAFNNTHLRDIVYERIQVIEWVEGTNTVVAFETPFSRGVALGLSPKT